MTELMIISGLVLIICITSTKVLYKFGVPILLIFIVLGMLFGSDGLVGIYFDNYTLTNQLCSIGLVFIMFYGGFGTNWKMARPVAVPSILMSSLGVIITAALTGLFCNLVIKTTVLEGLLIGAIVSSTDAASVFAILRAQKLNLKGSLASFLEVESGSNDPIAYMMTIIVLVIMKNPSELSLFTVVSMIVTQIAFGLIIGFLLAKLTVYVLRYSNFEIEGFYTIFVMAVAILSYALSEFLGGNGYLSVYIAGIIIGNSKIPRKKSIFHFFDGISWIMQMVLFFMLGLLSFPSRLTYVTGTAVAISVFMILVARPLSTFIILSPFKFTIKEKIFISWVGLRGAASVVFAILAVTYGVNIENDIFHIIFFIALFSVSIQGTLIPKVANLLNLVDNEDKSSVLKTFNDYAGEINNALLEVNITEDNKWVNKTIIDANIPEDILIVMIKRESNILVPKGSTLIRSGDILVLSGNNIESLIE
ncbi:potassium/proton antiporter, CPA1 family (TC 2.A.36) [Clostridium collagenovorans DSM 3089]|uniref:Potassium/proton antiporter, CPA1 family (TC 2.A.36) n=1 Tax=Clostridium collagenovorans DSM 3089 TaxID=1121306 RepID=A0A1M5X7E7_9CLOT|nr:potassium/proton antiporter [Clostridium collagenovorans]SHH95719.1 potassium/proton antiporter, CPA1 family (TC 2.A.36) [Clostridium collagenovorans DSM 3089]